MVLREQYCKTVKSKKMNEIKLDNTRPIISQLQELYPEENVIFTGLRLLTEQEHILKFFSEMTEIYKKDDPHHPDPRVKVCANLVYISRCSESLELQWKRFFEVLEDQYEEAKKIVKLHVSKCEKV